MMNIRFRKVRCFCKGRIGSKKIMDLNTESVLSGLSSLVSPGPKTLCVLLASQVILIPSKS